MNQESLIARLKTEMVDIALEAMKTPTDRGLYQCGREAGVVQGLERALEIINLMLHEEAADSEQTPDDGFRRTGEIVGKSPYFGG